MGSMKISGSRMLKGARRIAVALAATAVLGQGAFAATIPKSGASTFLDDVPGLSLAPRTVSVSKATRGRWSAMFANTRIADNGGVHLGRITTPMGPLHELGFAAGSKKMDVGAAVIELCGEWSIAGGATLRLSDRISANAVVKSNGSGKPELVLNTDIAASENLGLSARRDGKGVFLGADVRVIGFLPSVSVSLKGGKVDANVWSPSIGPGKRVRVTLGVGGIGRANDITVGLRISL